LLQHDSHRGIQHLVAISTIFTPLNPLFIKSISDWHGFEWIDANDADNSVLSFIRRGPRIPNT